MPLLWGLSNPQNREGAQRKISVVEQPLELPHSGMLRDLCAPSKQGGWCRRKGPNSPVVSNNVPSFRLLLSFPSLPACHYYHQFRIGKWRRPRDFLMLYTMGGTSQVARVGVCLGLSTPPSPAPGSLNWLPSSRLGFPSFAWVPVWRSLWVSRGTE